MALGVERPRALVARYFREKVDWEGSELSEDEEGQLEVIRALPPKDHNATKLLLASFLRESGLLDLIPEVGAFCAAMGVDRNDPRALEKLLKKGARASSSGPRRQMPPVQGRNEGVPLAAPAGQAEV
ncbi:hypothetical protein Pyn_39278 [Prunus yedoensis var. nudiflora]|uniref:Uncharacterized protein n=1 Tax=Prunus yedoensis var. nudiflora TaxID=2094558 RepID=A0A314YG22_PRUYE|nr:hypothetical protein Pyn_39278 [Prunus yedoensis var. nudiflora]